MGPLQFAQHSKVDMQFAMPMRVQIDIAILQCRPFWGLAAICITVHSNGTLNAKRIS
jgi:hypothetical protein